MRAGVSEVEGVFVYGTLLPGFQAHEALLWGVLEAREGWAEGLALLHLPQGYPAAVPGQGRVRGVWLRLADLAACLPGLDAYEGHTEGPAPRLYGRRPWGVALDDGREVRAWLYVFEGEHDDAPTPDEVLGRALAAGAARVEAGDWRAWRAANQVQDDCPKAIPR